MEQIVHLSKISSRNPEESTNIVNLVKLNAEKRRYRNIKAN